jgi:hypothetical protein
MNSSIFGDITPGSNAKGIRGFGGTRRLHLQSRKIRQARNKPEADVNVYIFLSSFLNGDLDFFQ